MRHLRQTVAKVAAEHGLAILAAGTHPTADWRKSQQSEGERYDAVMDDLQMIGQRNMLCGLHVHVELPDPDDRVDVMTRMLPYLPLFIALGTSSPFWRSRPTGLKGYRLAAYDELPRTGVPELFRNKEEFDAYVDALVKAGVMQDSSYVWWSMRPSLKHPTLGAARARLPHAGRRFGRDRRALSRAGAPAHPQPASSTATSTRSRARSWSRTSGARSATACTAPSSATNGAITVADLLEQVIEEVAADAAALGCLDEVQRCRAIVGAGTSADAQMAVFEAHGKTEGRASALRRGDRLDRGHDAAVGAFYSPARQHRLHHQAASMRVDHAKPTQRDQRQRLHRLARACAMVEPGRRKRSDQALRARRRPAPAPQGPRPARADGRRRSRPGCGFRSSAANALR